MIYELLKTLVTSSRYRFKVKRRVHCGDSWLYLTRQSAEIRALKRDHSQEGQGR
jgi:serine/threonine protein phosphatase PrpC